MSNPKEYEYFTQCDNHLHVIAYEIFYLSIFYNSVVALESHPFSVGDTITMRLMKRAKVHER